MSAFPLRRPVRSTLTVPDNRENVYHRRMLLGTPSRQNPFSPGHTCTPGFLVTFVIPFGSFPETRCSPFEKFACFHAGSCCTVPQVSSEMPALLLARLGWGRGGTHYSRGLKPVLMTLNQ